MEARGKGGNAVVVTGGLGFGGDADSGPGGGADGGSQERDGTQTTMNDQLSEEDTVVTTTLGTEPNAPLAYDLGLELHQPIMNKLGENRGQCERDRVFIILPAQSS